MYFFAITLPVSGVVMGSFSGFGPTFFFTTIPSIKKEPAIAKKAYEIHKLLGPYFEYMIPVHIGGALLHVVKVYPYIAYVDFTFIKNYLLYHKHYNLFIIDSMFKGHPIVPRIAGFVGKSSKA